jgi:hypothetical protein
LTQPVPDFSRKPRGIFEHRPRVWITRTLERTWYVLLPLFGIWLSGATYIRPKLTEIQNTGTIARLKNESEGRRLLNEMNAAESQIRGATFERDSVLAPAVNRRLFLVDSLKAITTDKEQQILEHAARGDSIAAATLDIEKKTHALEESLKVVLAQAALLDSTRVQLEDSLARLRARAEETWTRARQKY